MRSLSGTCPPPALQARSLCRSARRGALVHACSDASGSEIAQRSVGDAEPSFYLALPVQNGLCDGTTGHPTQSRKNKTNDNSIHRSAPSPSAGSQGGASPFRADQPGVLQDAEGTPRHITVAERRKGARERRAVHALGTGEIRAIGNDLALREEKDIAGPSWHANGAFVSNGNPVEGTEVARRSSAVQASGWEEGALNTCSTAVRQYNGNAIPMPRAASGQSATGLSEVDASLRVGGEGCGLPTWGRDAPGDAAGEGFGLPALDAEGAEGQNGVGTGPLQRVAVFRAEALGLQVRCRVKGCAFAT